MQTHDTQYMVSYGISIAEGIQYHIETPMIEVCSPSAVDIAKPLIYCVITFARTVAPYDRLSFT
jgi:hypothetical protein